MRGKSRVSHLITELVAQCMKISKSFQSVTLPEETNGLQSSLSLPDLPGKNEEKSPAAREGRTAIGWEGFKEKPIFVE
jgi:hypothetical protein